MSQSIITVENLSKAYRLGQKEERADTLVGALQGALQAPLKNWRHLARLNTFRHQDEADDLFWALKDVSFEVQEGEALGVIGRNGAGKSTLLKILSRITEPTAGRAVLRGRVSSLLEVGTGFHPELSGRDNVYMNGTILGMTKREIDRKFDEIVEFSGVEKFLDTPIKHYSSGMKVRLAFAVAAHLEPEILIIDEVLAVGDAEFQKKCLGKMEDVTKGGRTVLFVSHNMAAVRSLTSRSVYLAGGRIAGVGATESIIDKYFAATFELPRTHGQDCLEGYRKFDSSQSETRLTRVWTEVGRDAREGIPRIPLGGSFALNFEIESTSVIQPLYLVLILTREGDQRVATLFSGDVGFRFSSHVGRQTVVCRFDRPPFSPGRYTVEARLTLAPGAKSFDAVIDYPAFEIEAYSEDNGIPQWPTRPWGAVHLNDEARWSVAGNESILG